MNDQQQSSGQLKRDLNLFVAISQCFAYQAEAWLRVPGSAGSRYFTGHAFIGWFLLLIVAAFGRSEPLTQFWLLTGALFLIHWLTHYIRQRRGYRPHSRYVGDSLLSFLGGNRLAVRLWEPLLTLFFGFQLINNGYGFGELFMVLSFCLFVSASFSAAAERAMITAMHDARADQAWLTEIVRKG